MSSVVEAIDKIIPVFQQQKITTERLRWIRQRASYLPPEQQQQCWGFLKDHFTDLKTAGKIPETVSAPDAPLWSRQVVALAEDRPVPNE